MYKKELHGQSHPPEKSMPLVLLRRRIKLQDIESIFLSKYADTCVGLLVRQASAQKEGDKSNWIDNKKVPKCPTTGTDFGVFTWRHHCR